MNHESILLVGQILINNRRRILKIRLIFGIRQIGVSWESLLWHAQDRLLRRLLRRIRLVFVVRFGVRELEAENVIAVEAITLQSVDDNRGLESRFEIGEAQDDFFAGLLLPRDEADSLEAQKWSKNMRNFTLSGVDRNALNINSIGGVRRNRKNSVLIKHRLKMGHKIKLLLGLSSLRWRPRLQIIEKTRTRRDQVLNVCRRLLDGHRRLRNLTLKLILK